MARVAPENQSLTGCHTLLEGSNTILREIVTCHTKIQKLDVRIEKSYTLEIRKETLTKSVNGALRILDVAMNMNVSIMLKIQPHIRSAISDGLKTIQTRNMLNVNDFVHAIQNFTGQVNAGAVLPRQKLLLIISQLQSGKR